MLLQIIISLTVIITLTIVMSFLLARIVKQVNKQSKDYFEKKIAVYDDLIDEKQKRLDNIESEIKKTGQNAIASISTGTRGKEELVVMNEKMPAYKVDGLLEMVKTIDDEFKLDKASAVRNFVTRRAHESSSASESLSRLYNSLKNDKYKYITNSTEDGWEEVMKMMDERTKSIMKQYIIGNPTADINEIISYIKLELDKASPEVIVETGDKNDNFGTISNNIKTVYNPNIYMGIRIFYQDRMYDYSLRSEG